MTRHQLEHVIRTAASTADVTDIVVIGSQAILGAYPTPPMFHKTFGYYAHGVDETTAILPDGWRDRLIKVSNANTMGAVGWCLEPHDLAMSK